MERNNSLPYLTKFMNGKVYERNNFEKIMSEIYAVILFGIPNLLINIS